MRKSLFLTGMLTLAAWVIPSEALAISCPAVLGDGGDARQYTLTVTSGNSSADACVYGSGNINGGTNDAFLGTGGAGNTIDGNVGGDFSDPTTWVRSNNQIVGLVGGTSSGTFTLSATAGEEYGIGLKDGGDPRWAVFLIDALALNGLISGDWSILGGGTDALSHYMLYERAGTPPPPVPTTPDEEQQTPGAEPTTLLLLGAGLAVASRRLRRRTTV